MSRTLARERAFQLTYELEIQQVSVGEQLDWHFTLEPCKDVDEEAYIRTTVSGIFDHLEEIDGTIERYSRNWKKNRISKVDLAILRLSIFEILFSEQVPNEVAVNEAVELSKRYADNSASFVNGILSSVMQEVKEKVDDGE